MRLDKLLSHAGYGSRKDVKKLIVSGTYFDTAYVYHEGNSETISENF